MRCNLKLEGVTFISCLSTADMSASAGFLFDKTDVPRDTIKGTRLSQKGGDYERSAEKPSVGLFLDPSRTQFRKFIFEINC